MWMLLIENHHLMDLYSANVTETFKVYSIYIYLYLEMLIFAQNFELIFVFVCRIRYSWKNVLCNVRNCKRSVSSLVSRTRKIITLNNLSLWHTLLIYHLSFLSKFSCKSYIKEMKMFNF